MIEFVNGSDSPKEERRRVVHRLTSATRRCVSRSSSRPFAPHFGGGPLGPRGGRGGGGRVRRATRRGQLVRGVDADRWRRPSKIPVQVMGKVRAKIMVRRRGPMIKAHRGDGARGRQGQDPGLDRGQDRPKGDRRPRADGQHRRELIPATPAGRHRAVNRVWAARQSPAPRRASPTTRSASATTGPCRRRLRPGSRSARRVR